MEVQGENRKSVNGQLISVPHRDTIRLLEVYITRSLSLNDSEYDNKKSKRKEKWVTNPRRKRLHSSDPSIHIPELPNGIEIGPFSVFEPSSQQPEKTDQESQKTTRKSRKNKKSSFWKNLLGFFSPKNEEKSEEEDDPPEIPEVPQLGGSSDSVTTYVPNTPTVQQKKKLLRKKPMRRKFSKQRLSLTKHSRSGKDHAEITRVDSVISVEPTYSYYEKVTEELEKIVIEVQEKEQVEHLSDEELINRIIALTKEQGDAIDDKLKENPTLNSFFQRMSYSSFQELADAYLEKEASPTHNPPTVLPTAPELVKLAFTYDFTAKIARLSKQNVCHITGLGNRYLQERFEYKQVCTEYPLSDDD
ncbi:uncharacterized protein [Takifugu rubripes]|uniref:uncharacterized protein n=1 Tax=Takifugu rubripes TaxID=31033 RepID=UPI0005D176E3|nr:uncharacterized protein LOC105417803 [Takifugu rubripes]XP_011611969.1 uncharacterized protein LOC105417803 [Takifugu rubripes]|eukprot:XP_011611968.1 PREDICTED: uncharacterized protein LOC105417803 [Takifugu rubripes]